MLQQIRPAIMMIVVMTVHHRPRLSAGDDRHRAARLPASGQWQPDREGRQGHRLRADRPELRRREIFPRPARRRRPSPIPKDADQRPCPAPYAADNSGGSNLAPTAQPLIDRVKDDAGKLHAENPSAPVPVDLVTTSASGLDPDITPAAALFQVPRVAKARGLPEERVQAARRRQTRPRFSASSASRASTCSNSISPSTGALSRAVVR